MRRTRGFRPPASARSPTSTRANRFLESLPGPYVVKTDGLAAGKGVLVTGDLAEAKADVVAKLSGSAFGDAGRMVVIEEGLAGPELTLLVLTDGIRAIALPPSQDFKRLRDGDLGPNTGGMGAYSPVPVAGPDVVDRVMAEMIEPTLAALRARSIEYRGVLYTGCMLTEEGPKLIEYNVRFGDPEAEVVLPRIENDVFGLLAEAGGRNAAQRDEIARKIVGLRRDRSTRVSARSSRRRCHSRCRCSRYGSWSEGSARRDGARW